MSEQKMPIKQRVFIVNFAIMLGLVYEYWRGVPLWIDALCGVFLCVLANLLMMFKARSKGTPSV
jgi:uncharacterized membrane protein YagU involved in acid resistance